MVASTNAVQTSADSNGSVQPIAKARTQAGALSVRRKLSIIFQRPIRGSSPLPAKPRIQGKSCQSPRAHL